MVTTSNLISFILKYVLGCFVLVSVVNADEKEDLPHYLSKQERVQLQQTLNTTIDFILADDKVDLTGMTVAVQFQGEPLMSRAVGYADQTEGRLANEHTSFRIGSVTKVFTALSIMQLQEQGKLSLNDSIFDHLPDYQPKLLPGVNPDNRIRDLLTHHNGVPSLWLKGLSTDKNPLEAMRELPAQLSKDYLVENRREVHAYTNAAYGLLGVIIENVSGLSYDDYLKQNFFLPYSMSDAYAFLPSEIADNMALPHQGHQSFPSVGSPMVADGSIFASAVDMNQFSQAIIDTWHQQHQALVKRKTLKKMSKPQHKNVKYDIGRYRGLGFSVNKDRGFKALGHNGLIETFSSSFQVIPELELGVFVSTNGAETLELSDFVLNTILNEIAGEPTNTTVIMPSDNSSPLPYTGPFILQNAVFEFIQEGDQAFLDGPDSIIQLETLKPNLWRFVENPNITLKTAKSFKGYEMRINGLNSGLPVTPLLSQPEDNVWHQRLNQTFATLDPNGNPVTLTFGYDDEFKTYYVYSQSSIGEVLWPLKVINHKVIQIQGKGRNAGLVMEMTEGGQIQFSGLLFDPV